MNFDLWPREKTIFCHKMRYTAITRPFKAMLSWIRSYMIMKSNKTIRGHIRLFKATQGHTRQTRQFNSIIWRFCSHCNWDLMNFFWLKETFFVPLHILQGLFKIFGCCEQQAVKNLFTTYVWSTLGSLICSQL